MPGPMFPLAPRTSTRMPRRGREIPFAAASKAGPAVDVENGVAGTANAFSIPAARGA
jgi:hypothetical protein